MDDKYGVKVENRYALFLDEDDNDENKLIEQVTAKAVKNAAAPATTGKTSATPSPQKGVKSNQSTPIATDVRVKSAAGSKKPQAPSGTTAAPQGAKAVSATSKDSTQASAPAQTGRPKFGRNHEANEQNTETPRDYDPTRPRGGGHFRGGNFDRPNSGNEGGGNRGGAGGNESRGGYRGDGERRGGFRGGFRGGEGGGGYRGDRQDRPPRQQRNIEDTAEQRGDQEKSDNSAAGAGQFNGQEDRRGDNFGQREGGFNNEHRGYGSRGSYRGHRGGFRGGRNDGDQADGRRQYDRHSGNEQTGIKAVEKKQGAGGHNWGQLIDQQVVDSTISESRNEENEDGNQGEGENAHVQQSRKRALTKEEEDRAENERKNREVKEAERLADEKKMTLQQYKEMQKENKEAPKFNLRKPGEGEDSSWMKTVTVVNESKKTHVEQEEEGRKDRHAAPDHNLAHDMLGISYAPSSRAEQRGDFRGGFRGDRRGGHREGGRGDRGGYGREGDQEGGYGRGGYGGDQRGHYQGGRGGGGARKQGAPAPRITDPKDFPALGLGKPDAGKAAVGATKE